MIPTTEILENVKRNSKNNREEVFTRLYRYMLRPDLYFQAYKNLYANSGASTRGVDNDTADGFSEEKIAQIINSLADETYTPRPARREYIKKANGKMRPLGIPTFTDKLVQEVLRMILEAVYEPIFLDCSHGFRPNRSCHTALKDISKGFVGTHWFVEGDIKGCFDNIDHQALVSLISNKIKDARLVKLIWKMLKAGYLEDWKYHGTYSGTPQGGIISPLFANIYLHELDKYVTTLKSEFDCPATQKYNADYDALRRRVELIRRHLKKAEGEQKSQLLKELHATRAKMLQTPAKSQTDKRIKYVRYADDFIIGVCGIREDCVEIKRKLTEFIGYTLKMELSAEKTLITHSCEQARFLGYDVRVRRNGSIKPNGAATQRTLNYKVELNAPMDKVTKFMFDKKVVERTEDSTLAPIHRKTLLNCTELEIVTTYNAELRGICNYYSIASNFISLKYFAYLMEYSCLKTLASKRKSSISKIKEKFKDGKGKWGVPYETKSGVKRCYFAYYGDCKNSNKFSDVITKVETVSRNSVNSFEKRLKANVCELCDTTASKHYEIHHVHKVKDLKGDTNWERAMKAKKRKTLVVCRECHKQIHGKRESKTEQ